MIVNHILLHVITVSYHEGTSCSVKTSGTYTIAMKTQTNITILTPVYSYKVEVHFNIYL